MPRIIGNVKEGDCVAAVATKVRRNAIKKEVESPGEQQVFHRKSERRRVARDIFLVFEEQPRGRPRGSNKKKGPQKPKFGHLNVEEPVRSRGNCATTNLNSVNTKQSLLRDIKNEPKCYLSSSCPVKARKAPSIDGEQANGVQTETSNDPIARVNPIFLWVKQDDTRIVEVRCEDYDKRNRIRITKTTNGWRAIPRTDPSSSKIVKVFQTPLLKVKRELYESNMLEKCNEDISSSDQQLPEGQCVLSTENDDGNGDFQNCEPALKQVAEQMEDARRKKKKKYRSKVRNSTSTAFRCRTVADQNKKMDDTSEPTAGIESDGFEEVVKTTEDESAQQIVSVICEQRDEKDSANRTIDNGEQPELETYHLNNLQLCPKTGLFLPNTNVEDNTFNPNLLAKSILVELAECQVLCEKTQTDTEQTVENLDADTKNLKDLLDDADLLQHCGDNAINGTEIIDSLVKRSCENNLIQESESLKEPLAPDIFTSHRGNLLEKVADVEQIPQIIDTVNDPPKCLSFNEAGEIEGLNGELFQSNNYIDSFDKVSVEEITLGAKKIDTTVVTIMPSPSAEDKLPEATLEDSPKDLTYKKREEVCPPPESRSQCAVTSSSDVVKSPQHREMPTVDTTSDTIKNMILDQFIKLNALNAISPPMSKPQQSEPIDLGKQKDSTATSESASYAPTTNYIETVVIDDNSDEEPVKKRLRNTVKHTVSLEETAVPSIIDKDPDPLTQLQLLIRNTQWKVPDPILVPKDRLGAVLASPAREIPLLITTRPELRLPEAFAYPEIIQNPNILVISMAQLEAILRNEMEVEKNKPQRPVAPSDLSSEVGVKKLNPLSTKSNESQSLPSKETNAKCSHAESSLASDINAATLAVLNQMLWLPYFGQLSQEFLKSLKGSVSVQSKYPSLLPIYNHHLGLQHLDELYKSYLKQINSLKHLNEESSSNPLVSCPSAIGTFPTPVEVAVFQKLLQHQMHNFLNVNPITDIAEKETLGKSTSNEVTSHMKLNSTEVQQVTKNLVSVPPSTASISTSEHSGGVSLAERSFRQKNIESSCDNSLAENGEFNKYACMQKQESENKPRLTCKSLSNLLEPETAALPTAALVNLSSDSIRNTTRESSGKQTESKSISKEVNCLQAVDSMSLPNGRLAKVNPSLSTAHELTKQRKRSLNFLEPAAAEQTPRNMDSLNMDTNPALWHPLFGRMSLADEAAIINKINVHLEVVVKVDQSHPQTEGSTQTIQATAGRDGVAAAYTFKEADRYVDHNFWQQKPVHSNQWPLSNNRNYMSNFPQISYANTSQPNQSSTPYMQFNPYMNMGQRAILNAHGTQEKAGLHINQFDKHSMHFGEYDCTLR